MESSTAPAAPSSTGSTTIADLMGLATERYGDRTAVKFKRGDDWVDVSYRELGDDRVRDRPRADRPRPRARRPRRRALHARAPSGRTPASGSPAPAASWCRSTPRTRRRSASGWRATPSRGSCSPRTPSRWRRSPQVRDRLPNLEAVIVMDGDAPDAIRIDDLRERGRGRDHAEVAARAAAVKPEDPYTFIYTSGTTGPPKGCVLLARQLPVGGHDVRGGVDPPRGRRRLPVPAARPLVRAADRADRDRPRRHDRLLGRRPEGHRRAS